MIVISENDQASMVINDTSVIMKENGHEEDENKNILTNYINELKSYEKAEVKCMSMLEKNINQYDDKFIKEI